MAYPGCLGIEEFIRADIVILLDLEYTCWEDSLSTRWSDPARPPEVLEVALASYNIPTGEVQGTFTRFVRPRLNPRLSQYCVSLLQISQGEIDSADHLEAIIAEIGIWEAKTGAPGRPTCSWGVNDRCFLAADAARGGVEDPFHGRGHFDLRSLVRSRGPRPKDLLFDRDDLRTQLGLPPNPGRHRALADTLDLVHFCQFLQGVPRVKP